MLQLLQLLRRARRAGNLEEILTIPQQAEHHCNEQSLTLGCVCGFYRVIAVPNDLSGCSYLGLCRRRPIDRDTTRPCAPRQNAQQVHCTPLASDASPVASIRPQSSCLPPRWVCILADKAKARSRWSAWRPGRGDCTPARTRTASAQTGTKTVVSMRARLREWRRQYEPAGTASSRAPGARGSSGAPSGGARHARARASPRTDSIRFRRRVPCSQWPRPTARTDRHAPLATRFRLFSG